MQMKRMAFSLVLRAPLVAPGNSWTSAYSTACALYFSRCSVAVREPIGPAPNHDPGTSISTARSTCCWPGYCLTTATNLSIVAWQAAGAARRPAHLPLWTTGLRRDCPDHINVILSDPDRAVTKTLFFFIRRRSPGRDETGGRRGHRRRAAARQRRWRGRVSGSDEDSRNDGKICRSGQAVSWPAAG